MVMSCLEDNGKNLLLSGRLYPCYNKDMDKLHVKYSVDILDELTPTLRTIVSNFRTSVPDINGKIRTPKEEIIHQEKFCSDSDIKLWILVFEKNMLIGTTAVYAYFLQRLISIILCHYHYRTSLGEL